MDNSSCQTFYSAEVEKFIGDLVEVLNAENAEFVTNLVVFYYNMLLAKGGMAEVQERFQMIKTTIGKVLAMETP